MKYYIRDRLRKAGIFVYTRKSLPQGIKLELDLARLCPLKNLLTVFDVGANEGQTTAEFLTLFPSAHVFAFEPVGQTHKVLASRFGAHPRVTCERLAVSDTLGSGQMAVGDCSLVSHLQSAQNELPSGFSPEEVSLTTVDSYCKQHKLESIDLLKTDTEGHDLSVFKGAHELLSAKKVRFILTEVGLSASNRANTPLGEVYDFLRPLGFVLQSLYDPRHLTKQPDMPWADALFAHQSQLLAP